MNIVQLIVSLSILVFIHELGHFAFARLFGARVEKFYLFFNPWFSLYKWQSKRSGTIYGLGWLPLGGYCQIAGMVDESMDTEQLKSEPKPDEFRSKTTWQRLLIMAGGILFNFVLAFFIYTMVSFVWGGKQLPTTSVRDGWAFSTTAEQVGFVDGDIIYSIDGQTELNALDNSIIERMVNAKEVVVLRSGEKQNIAVPSDMMQRVLRDGKGFASINMPFVIDSVANDALRASGVGRGDKLISVAGEATPNLQSALEALNKHAGKEIQLGFERDSLSVKASIDSEGRLGVVLTSPEVLYPIEHISYGFFASISAGIERTGQTLAGYVQGLKHIFTKEGAKSLGGLGTMAKLFAPSFDWQSFWLTTAFLSIILGVMNLLPIPALDGGHIVFILIEMVTGRKPNDKVMGYIQMTGMILLLGLMLYANGNDIYRYLIKS